MTGVTTAAPEQREDIPLMFALGLIAAFAFLAATLLCASEPADIENREWTIRPGRSHRS